MDVDPRIYEHIDFMALLVYEEPAKSPMFHLLSLEYWQHVAESLNRAILAHANHPSYTAMERLIQQTTVVRQCLNQEHSKDRPPPIFFEGLSEKLNRENFARTGQGTVRMRFCYKVLLWMTIIIIACVFVKVFDAGPLCASECSCTF